MTRSKLTARNLKGPWAGVTLPWNEDYSFDEASFRENLRRLCSFDVPGIYTTGSTGEFYVLDLPEFRHMVDVFMEVVGPTGKPTQVGCCADDTRETIRLAEYAAGKGADGLQIVLPYWMELTDKEVTKFFKDIYTAVPETPLIHYNIPRAKRFLLGADYRRLLDAAPTLIGVKFTFAGSHFGSLQTSLQLTPELSYFVGENLLVSAMMLGAQGSYSSIVCTNPAFMLQMHRLADDGDWEPAMQMQRRLDAFFHDLGAKMEELDLGGMDPVADKGLAAASGLFVGHQRTRPPYIGWSDEGVRAIRGWMIDKYPEFIAPGFE